MGKWSKPGHDVRFDIPVIGKKTLRILKKSRVSALALQAGRSILLEREHVVAAADQEGITILVVGEPVAQEE